MTQQVSDHIADQYWRFNEGRMREIALVPIKQRWFASPQPIPPPPWSSSPLPSNQAVRNIANWSVETLIRAPWSNATLLELGSHLDGFNGILHLEETTLRRECIDSSVILTPEQNTMWRELRVVITNELMMISEQEFGCKAWWIERATAMQWGHELPGEEHGERLDDAMAQRSINRLVQEWRQFDRYGYCTKQIRTLLKRVVGAQKLWWSWCRDWGPLHGWGPFHDWGPPRWCSCPA